MFHLYDVDKHCKGAANRQTVDETDNHLQVAAGPKLPHMHVEDASMSWSWTQIDCVGKLLGSCTLITFMTLVSMRPFPSAVVGGVDSHSDW